MSKITMVEQETIILYNQAEKNATVYTHDKTLINRMKEYPSIAILKSINDCGGYTFEVPKKQLRITLKKQFTPEELEKKIKAAEHMRNVSSCKGGTKKISQSKGETPPQN